MDGLHYTIKLLLIVSYVSPGSGHHLKREKANEGNIVGLLAKNL